MDKEDETNIYVFQETPKPVPTIGGQLNETTYNKTSVLCQTAGPSSPVVSNSRL